MFLSALIPGVGQAYLGQVYRGAAILLVGIGIALTLYYFFGTIIASLTIIFWGWNMIDVYTVGKAISQGNNNSKSRQCHNCDGRGAVRTGSSMSLFYSPPFIFTRCPSCDGTGTLPVT